MISRRFSILTALLVSVLFTLSAQDIVVVDGVKYAVHDVARGETLYSLARAHGVTVDDIRNANSSLQDGLKAGMRIRIPIANPTPATESVSVPSVQAEQTNNSAKQSVHKVVRGETIYSLARQYGVSEEQLRETNPHIGRGLKAGQILTIPSVKQPSEVASEVVAAPSNEVVAEDSVKPKEEVVKEEVRFKTINREDVAEVALLLPLGSEEKPSQNYLDFYRGFLVGLDSVRMQGYSINLNLYNTAHSHARIEEIIASGALRRSDLVVGPVYEDELIPVVSSLNGCAIPVVSPLANLTTTISPRVFQMSPSPANKCEKVRSLFDGSKRVVIISAESVDTDFEKEVLALLEGRPYVQHKYIFEHPSVIEKREKEREKLREEGLEVDETPSPSDMSPLLQGSDDTVFVITASDETDVNRILAAIASANIALTARSQPVSPFVIFGNNRWNRYRNIDRDKLFLNNVSMLSTYHIRRSEPVVKSFDTRFAKEFGTMPSLYAYRGYDAAVVFVKALYGTIADGMLGQYTRPLLTPYTFEQDPTTGVRINSQWIKVNYNSNFTITTE